MRCEYTQEEMVNVIAMTSMFLAFFATSRRYFRRQYSRFGARDEYGFAIAPSNRRHCIYVKHQVCLALRIKFSWAN